MKGIAAIAVAMLIAAVGASWFLNSPNIVTVKVSAVRPNPALPTFKQVEEQVQRDAQQQNTR